MEMDMNTKANAGRFKPYTLVWVREPTPHTTCGEVEYVGQVMSFLTPDNTYMVRRVPGHPGTLVELSSRNLYELARHPTRERFSQVAYAVVGGRGQFPVDMLRYDNCSPVNFRILDTEAGPKAQMLEGCEGEDMLVAKAVSASNHITSRWTPQRWSSFMWGFRELRVIPLTDE